MGEQIRNVVLVSLDTLRADCVGAYPVRLFARDYPGQAPPRTPVLDELAGRAAFFRNCISAAPYTSASHGALLTGRFPLENGLFEVFNRGLRSPTVFAAAQRAGYHTVLTSDFPLILGPFLGFTRHVDEFLVEDEGRFVDRVREGGVFGLAHYGGIHYPYGFHNLRFGGAPYREKVRELEAKYPVAGFDFKDRIVESWRDTEDLDMLLRYKRVVQYLYAEEAYAELFALYVEGIEHFLETRFRPFLERLLDALAGTSSLVAVFADHGEQWDPDSYGHHNSLNEGVLRVPLFLFGDGVPSGFTHDGRVRTVDLVPTLLEWMGVRGRGPMSGESLWPILRREPGADAPRVALAQAHNCEPVAFTRAQERLLSSHRKTGHLEHVLTKEVVYDGPYKYIRHHRVYRHGTYGIEPTLREELYRVDGDLVLTAADGPVPPGSLGALLDDYNRRKIRSKTTTPPPELRQFLSSFGYLGTR